jgi:hypothetical protein
VTTPSISDGECVALALIAIKANADPVATYELWGSLCARLIEDKAEVAKSMKPTRKGKTR